MTTVTLHVTETTNKGKPLSQYEGYTYQIEKQGDNAIYWVCSKKSKKKCNCGSRMITTALVNSKCLITKHNTPHNHNVQSSSELLKTATKRRIQETVSNCKYLKTGVIINKLHSEDEVSGCLPNDVTLKRQINYQKRKLYPVQPKSFADITIESIDINTINDENFLLHSSPTKNLLIFGTVNNMEMLCQSSHWMGDGTFYIVPCIFEQLFTLFGYIHEVYYPLIYVLLSDKKQSSYEQMLEGILEICNKQNVDPPEHFIIHLDYEVASSNAFTKIFPQCQIGRCLFHLSQSLYRRVTSLGLKQLYMENTNFRDSVKKLVALTFLPADEIVQAFDDLMQNVCPEAVEVYKYFSNTYVKGSLKYTTRSGVEIRNAPLFPPSQWSSHDNTVEGIQRSNNVQEGWHNRLKHLCHKSHPCFGEFLEILLLEDQHVNRNMKLHLQNALQRPKRKKQDELRDKLLQLLVSQYDSGILNQEELLIGVIGNVKIDE